MALGLTAAASILVGCPSGGSNTEPWSQEYVPTFVAVIEDAEYTGGAGGRNVRLHLASGDVLERDLNQMMQVDPSNSPRDGDLWITGMIGDTEWYYAAPLYSDGCFRLTDRAREIDGEIWLGNGLRLRKAGGFEAPGLPGLDVRGGVEFCLNDRGEVVRASL